MEANGDQVYHLTSRELAIICGSHDGSDEHVSVIQGIQSKVGVQESDLLCGTHPPLDESIADLLKVNGQLPTPNRHNCSGKHTAMLAYAAMLAQPISNYVDFDHLIQQNILTVFAEMCDMERSQVVVGRDGCSVPAFGVPLFNAALSFARLCDPHFMPIERAAACRRITSAMTTNPDMVAGPKRFDTRLMQVGNKRIICKAGHWDPAWSFERRFARIWDRHKSVGWRSEKSGPTRHRVGDPEPNQSPFRKGIGKPG
jgi:L-asparaginase II